MISPQNIQYPKGTQWAYNLIPQQGAQTAHQGKASLRPRTRLRRLTATCLRLSAQMRTQKETLRNDIRRAAFLLARLRIYSGPGSEELFRLSLQPQKAELRREERAGLQCLQIFRQQDGGAAPLPRFTSLLTAPQTDAAQAGIEQMTESLRNYLNTALQLRAALHACRTLRRQLRAAEPQKTPRAPFPPAAAKNPLDLGREPNAAP